MRSSDASTARVRAFQRLGEPVVSVDTRKKEVVGQYPQRRPGMAPPRATLRPSMCMTSPDPELGKAIPYGVYDLTANAGWVSVGIDHDTAAFAGRDPAPLGGGRWAARSIPTPGACWSPPTVAAPTAAATGCGSLNCSSSPTNSG